MDLANLRVLFGYEGLEQLNSALNKAQGQAEHNFTQLTRSVGMGMTAVGAAITGTLGLFTKSAMSFEKGMRDVGTLGVENLQRLREGVLDFSTAMGQDAVESTENLYQIISKGIPEENALSVLESSAKGAASGVGEVSDALDLGTSIINAYNLEVSEFENIMGNAVTAVKYGSTTIGDLGGSIGRVAPIASQTGVSMQELFAAIAGVTAVGVNTQEAITGLRAALSGVIKPTSEATDLAEALGIQFDATALRTQGLQGFLTNMMETVEKNGPVLAQYKSELENVAVQTNLASDAAKERIKAIEQEMAATQEQIAIAGAQGDSAKELREHLKALKAEQQALTAETKTFEEELKELRKQHEGLQGVSDDTLTTMAALFGSIRGLNTVLALTAGKGAVKFQQAIEATKDGAKTLNETFEAWKKNNPELAYRQARMALRNMGIEIGTVLLPVLAELAQSMIPIAKWVSHILREYPRLSKWIIMGTAAFGAFNLALGPLLIKLPAIIGLFKGLAGIQMAGNISGAASAMGGLAGMTGAAGGALVAALPVIAAVGAAVIILAPLIRGVAHEFRNWRDAVDEQRASEERLNAKIGERIAQLELQGIAVDHAKIAEMNYNERILYLNQLERDSQDATLRKHLETQYGKQAAQEAFVQAKNLMLNTEMTMEEAAAIAVMDIHENVKRNLMQADAEKTQGMLEMLGIRTQAARQGAEEEQKAAQDTAAAQQETVHGMESLASGIEGTTGRMAKSVEQRTGAVADSMEQMTEDNSRAVERMADANTGHLASFDERANQHMGGAQDALVGFEDEMAQVPEVTRNAMQETAMYVWQTVNQMEQDLARGRAALRELDPNLRHSPSINDRIRQGLHDMGGMITGQMGDIQRVLGQTRDEWMRRWTSPPEIQIPRTARVDEAATHLTGEFATALRAPDFHEFSRTGRFREPAHEAARGNSVNVHIANMQVTGDQDVERVINEIAMGIKRKLIMGGDK
jgi:hypothetical protein